MEFSAIHANVVNLVMSAVQNGIISSGDLMDIATSEKPNPTTPIATNVKAVLGFALRNGLLDSTDLLDVVGNKRSRGSKGAVAPNVRIKKESRPLPPDSKPGDWFCPECNNTNFARRKECNICKAPRPFRRQRPMPMPPLEPGFWPKRELRPAWSPGPAAFPPTRRRILDRSTRQTQETKPKPPETLPGDWLCEECGNTNFARRNRCNIATCKAPKPVPFDSFFRPREISNWGPPMNRFGPWKRRRGEFEQPPTRRPRPPEINPGDWLCKLCGNTNFARRTECNISTCRAPRPG